MRASRHVLVVALACLSNICLSIFCLSSLAAAQPSDQVIAERVLGPQWKQLSRRAEMIFAGTVLTVEPQTAATQTATTQTAPPNTVVPGTAPAVQLTFRVDRAISGVERGQILTIHEWAGAWAMQRPMRKGQHILIFLYPPSRLGFTSPVGGSMGQVALDPSGENVSQHEQKPDAPAVLRSESSSRPLAPVVSGSVSVVQLERAIRSARNEEE
ncbi:MAG: hypothetical protein ABSD76_03880 [Terriglobales bacterium]|jgi:hypothetical protein